MGENVSLIDGHIDEPSMTETEKKRMRRKAGAAAEAALCTICTGKQKNIGHSVR